MPISADPHTLHVGETLTCRAAVGGRVVSFDAHIRHVDSRGLYIDRPDGIADELTPGSEVLVRYVRRDAAYQFLTLVHPASDGRPAESESETGEPGAEDAAAAVARALDPEPDPRYLPLLLRFPSRVTRYQRRVYDRARVEGVVQCRRPGGDIRTWRGYLVDLSAGGVRLATRQTGFLDPDRNPVGSPLILTLLLPKGYEIRDIPSEIRRVTLDKTHPSDEYLVVQAAFREMNARQRAKLDAWVQRQRKESE